MPNIKPISDLRNYSKVLNEVAVGSPVFLTYNGHGKYVILDIREYDELHGKLKSLAEFGREKVTSKYIK